MDTKKQTTTVPQWIKNLQENSWELELLISGGVIFSLFKLADVFLDFGFMMKMTSAIPATDIIIILGMIGIKILTVGFSIHLMLRAFWLGMVCINYVFPEGIKEKPFKNKIPFKDSFKEGGSLQDEIIAIDNASGIVMYVSIITSIVLIGIMLSFGLLAILILSFSVFGLEIFTSAFMLVLAIYFIDLFTFGFLRKVKYLSYVLFPFFKFFDFVTLRFVFQKSLVLFSSNVKKLAAVIGILALVLFSSFLAYVSLYRVMHWPNVIDSREYRWTMAPSENFLTFASYLDQVQQKGLKVVKPVIQSEVIKDNLMMIYIPYNKRYDFILDLKEGETISDYINVAVDDSVYRDIEWYNYWTVDNDEIGVKAYISIEKLSNGPHKLSLGIDKKADRRGIISFWKDVR